MTLATSRSWRRVCGVMGGATILVQSAAALPPRGADAPEITATTVGGKAIGTAQFGDRPMALVFGEFTNPATFQACRDVLSALSEERLAHSGVVPILLTAHEVTAEEVAARPEGSLPAVVMVDPQRAAFGAYKILVVPSVVVVGSDQKVVYAAPAFLPQFKTLVREALLVATGQESPEQLERSIAGDDRHQEAASRADRLVSLAEELAARRLYDMAEARLREALAMERDNARAHLALGRIRLRQGRAEEAEAEFRRVLELEPESFEGALGLARVQITRGGADLDAAEEAVRAALEKDPSSPTAHYLMGLIYDQRGRWKDAAAAYRTALEKLLDR
ncbi:MAG: tetratricopeptide repeat protein [Phycisphaerales bacterium JB039]